MKKIMTGITVFILSMAIISQRLEAISNLSKDIVFNKALVAYQTVISPFQAGYGYTQEEKNNAREEINILEQQRGDILVPYYKILCNKDVNQQEKDEYWNSIASSLYKLDGDIRELKLITGDVWSDARKKAWAGAALIGATLVTYKFFGPSVLAFVKKDNGAKKLLEEKKNQDALIIKEQEQKLAEQQKALDELKKQQEADKKRAEKFAQEKSKLEAQQKMAEALKKEEQLRQELNRKEAQRKTEEKQERMAQQKLEAQKQVDDIKKKIDECAINGQSDSDDVKELNKKLEQANEKLNRIKSNAELYICKEKLRSLEETELFQRELYFKEKKEREERRKKMIEAFEHGLKISFVMGKNIVSWMVKETPHMIQAVYQYLQGVKERSLFLTEIERDLLLNITFG